MTVSKRMHASDSDKEIPRKSTVLSPGIVLVWPAVLLLAALALGTVFLFAPLEHTFYPKCGFYQLTGLHCPGCGGFRAWHELLHGRWLTALHMNALAVTLLPGLVFWVVFQRVFERARDVAGLRLTPRIVIFWSVFVLAFGILRNIPWGPFRWLAP